MNKYFKLWIIVACLALVPWANASVKLPSLFSDHMVLQRDKPVLFWGTADANQSVTVSIKGQSVTTVADSKGDWKVHFPATSKSGPLKVTIAADQTIELNDVYFGDVWIAGGQSNMEWKLAWQVDNFEQELLDANYPAIRFFDVPNTVSHQKEKSLPASEWKLANAENAAEFSAVAWFFAKKLHLEENVAVGILESNWGGTPAEAWMDADAAKLVPGYAQRVNEIAKTKNWPTVFAENEKRAELKYSLIGNEQFALDTGAYKTSIDLSDWKPVTVPTTEPITDFVWLRKTFNLSQQPSADLTLHLGHMEQEGLIFINEKLVSKKTGQDSNTSFSIDKSAFKQGENLITLRLVNSWNNKVKLGRSGELMVETSTQKVNLEGQWFYNNTLEQTMPKVNRYSNTASFLYNAMLHPLLPYVSKGVIWYQGESNANEHALYHDLFSAMITNWRTRANNPNLAFLFVQLAAFQQPSDLQPKSGWAYLRDAQRETLALDNTGMAVAIDVGNPNDIHPRNKQDVGHRLWLQAAKKVYGKDVVASGPDYIRHNIQGNELVLTFDVTQSLTTSDGKMPTGFIIAGEDRKFYQADAKIRGNKVVVSSPKIARPKAVRYAWADYPNVNLVNEQQLPAVPFRTDDWTVDTLK
ncbi:sialate O-acetylesterase [Paraglaciecola aquimarina]|uniref:Sialate O-acetylesterase n=1 Tax=Paraglaciecola algarum TaxID=3050085 RepID=A0ABS9D978_9ALTE|nr:sialate O-acetylesterase [Paraglaciecola sp. G1-23]MCF2948547.1 sialate O-acetylesterase [Paraglaciecola sp. G1-23]